jgi:WXG100 family type VII secretion target
MATENKIDTKLFASTADSIGNTAKELGRLFESWQKTMNSMRGAWQGSSSDNVRNTAGQVIKSSNDLLRALSGYQSALREIAGIYDKSEQNAQESSKTLKFGNTFR